MDSGFWGAASRPETGTTDVGRRHRRASKFLAGILYSGAVTRRKAGVIGGAAVTGVPGPALYVGISGNWTIYTP